MVKLISLRIWWNLSPRVWSEKKFVNITIVVNVCMMYRLILVISTKNSLYYFWHPTKIFLKAFFHHCACNWKVSFFSLSTYTMMYILIMNVILCWVLLSLLCMKFSTFLMGLTRLEKLHQVNPFWRKKSKHSRPSGLKTLFVLCKCIYFLNWCPVF